jgi:t-SNARE complex subunit (syntaxin)
MQRLNGFDLWAICIIIIAIILGFLIGIYGPDIP